MITGIYSLYWEPQDLIYIGLSQDINARFKEHLNKLKSIKHSNYKVQNAYNLYGTPTLVVLEECNQEELSLKEVYWTKEFDSINNGLNIVEAGKVGWGVNSNASKYTKRQILKVFSLLYRTKLLYTEIAKRVGCNLSLPNNIANSISHIWLREAYPNKYRIMLNISRYSRLYAHNANKSEYKVVSSEGIIYSVYNIREFARKYALDSKCLNKVLLGQRKTHKGWKLYSSIEAANFPLTINLN